MAAVIDIAPCLGLGWMLRNVVVWFVGAWFHAR